MHMALPEGLPAGVPDGLPAACVPEGDTKEPEGGMVRESMRDVPEG